MPATAQTAIAVVGIDIGKNSFHIVGLDDRRRNCAASEMVAQSSGGAVREYAALSDRDGGLRGGASS